MYRLYVNSMSPYSSKASAAIGYAGLACKPVTQHLISRYATLKRLTGKTMVPVLRRGEWAINDSTRILTYVAEQTERPMLPSDEALEPLCWLLEEFADEWVARWVMWSRWSHTADAEQNAELIGREMTRGMPLVSSWLGRMAASGIEQRVVRSGASQINAEALERSRDRFLQELEHLLEDDPAFLFEAYPTVADFALYGQLIQYRRDPTGADNLRMYPNIGRYLDQIEAMELPSPRAPSDVGGSRPVEDVAPLFAEFLGTYWRLLVENHRAKHGDSPSDDARVELLDGESFEFRPSRYVVQRLVFVLEQLDEAYAAREELFGERGLELEQALVTQVARLTDDQAGRDLLRDYPHIGRTS
ncbi:MAG: glutathione S-transferase family protein [Persicimonas sp.]